jgi:hypothetical protein
VIGRKLNKLVRMQGVLRAFCAFKRMNRMRMAYPDMVTVTVTDLKDFVKVAGTTPEPLAIVNGMCLDLPANHIALNTIKGDVPAKVLQTNGHITSTFFSPTTVFPTSNASEAIAGGANRLDYVIVTIVDNASASKKDLIGQVAIKLSQIRNLSLGKPITLKLPLGPLKVEVKNAAGDVAAVTTRAPTGFITLTITRPLSGFNISGPVWKISDNVMALGAWKKRFFAVHKGQLNYYNSESSLESPKGSIACSTITNIEEETVAGRHSIKVTSKLQKGTPSVTWTLGFEEGASKAVLRKWMRVLYRNAPQLTPPVEVSAKQAKKNAAAAAVKTGSAKN